MRTSDFERLYDEHARSLYAFLAYRTGDPVLAEDLVADTFERVLTARKPFDPRRSSETTWIYAIALNRLRDVGRRSAAESRALARLSTESRDGRNGHDAVEDRRVIMAALDAIGAEEREALALRYGADLSLAQIAKVLGKPRSTVEGRIYKGLKHLRAELGDSDATGAEVRPGPWRAAAEGSQG